MSIYPSGLEGEELAMIDANRKTELFRKAARKNLIINISVGVLVAGFLVLAFATNFIGFAMPLFIWAGWNADKFFSKK